MGRMVGNIAAPRLGALEGNMRRLILTIGLPGSGKSYWASRQGIKVLSPDDYLTNENGEYQCTQERVTDAWARCYTDFGHWLANRNAPNVLIFDACFIGRIERNAVLNIARGMGVQVEAVYFDTPLSTCMDRQSDRSFQRRVPAVTIERMRKNFRAPYFSEGFHTIQTVCTSPEGVQVTLSDSVATVPPLRRGLTGPEPSGRRMR